jgi:LPXTG-site transpeptidase (sortase) family protein
MPAKNSSGATLSVIILTGLVFFLILFFCFVFKDVIKKDLIRPKKNAVTISKQTLKNYGLPVQLIIPSLNIKATIEQVGLTASGAMGVPKGRNNVAWYRSGPRPGEVGSAVIDGHYGTWKNGQATVFENLNKLKNGDKIYIKDDQGATISFVVTKTHTYNSNASASDVFSSNDGLAHLNLITCEGVWNGTTQSYSGRLVVFTNRQ